MDRVKRALGLLAVAGLLLGGCSGPVQEERYYYSKPPIPDDPMIKGKPLTPEQIEHIEQALRVGRDSAIACYTAELERRGNKELTGKVSLKILIGTNEMPKEVEVSESTLNVEEVHRCIVKAAKTWVFPKLRQEHWYSTTLFFDPAY